MSRSALAVAADFTANVTSGPAPLTVNFTNMSQGQYSSLSWTFGDGGTSNQENPAHTYNNPGTYTVTLTVTGPGGSDTETKTAYITVEDPRPKADFSAIPDSGMAPLSVQFTDLSTGNITSREWDFGDGSPKVSTKDPSHNYQNPGTYNAKLKVTAPGLLGSDEKTKTITVTAPPPVAKFTASPFHGASPLEVQFTDQSTGNITGRTWNFGGGTQVGSGQTDPRVRYESIGLYNVTLNVTGQGGSSSSSSQILVYQVIYVSKNDAGCSGNSPCRTKLQDAFNDAAQYALIKATQESYGENVSFTQQKTVMFQGGYNTSFEAAAGVTTAGQLSVGGSAVLIAERLQLQGGAASSASAGETALPTVYASDASREQGMGGEDRTTSACSLDAEDVPSIIPKVSRDAGSGLAAFDGLHMIIARIYRKALGREPSGDEVQAAAYYAEDLSRACGADVKYAFWELASRLFSRTHCIERGCLGEKDVSSAYLAILNRDALPDEMSYWLKAPAGMNAVLYALLNSEESGEALAEVRKSSDRTAGDEACSAYIALLERIPTEAELESWRDAPVEEIVAGILASEELNAKGLSKEEIGLRILLLEGDSTYICNDVSDPKARSAVMCRA